MGLRIVLDWIMLANASRRRQPASDWLGSSRQYLCAESGSRTCHEVRARLIIRVAPPVRRVGQTILVINAHSGSIPDHRYASLLMRCLASACQAHLAYPKSRS